MYYYLNYFFIFSIIGHLIESLLVLIFDWNFKSGYLYGYWTPVYGLGSLPGAWEISHSGAAFPAAGRPDPGQPADL